MSKASWSIPLGVFVLITAVSYVGFFLGDRHELPSPLVNQPFPEFHAPDLLQPQQSVDRTAVLGQPTLVNVWATWCPTCVAEHEMLMHIAAVSDVRIIGINYKDQRDKALDWLAGYGNPYDVVVEDANGLLGIELGVYGAPETFLVDASGLIVYKRIGEINQRIWQDEIKPRLTRMESL